MATLSATDVAAAAISNPALIDQAASPVPPHVSTFLLSATSARPFFDPATHDVGVRRVLAKVTAGVRDFMASNSFEERTLMHTRDPNDTEYLLFQQTPNVWERVTPVYGFALTSQDESVVITGHITANGWGREGVMTLGATGEVFRASGQPGLLDALRAHRAQAANH